MYDCVRSEKKQGWENLRCEDCKDSLNADVCCNFLLLIGCAKHKKNDEWELRLFRDENQNT